MMWRGTIITILFGLQNFATLVSSSEEKPNYLLRQQNNKELKRSNHNNVQTNKFIAEYTDEATNDMIAYLPGLDFEPNFKQFSGYLTISEETNKNIFYWYVESQSDPSTDPVLLWTNGGPGCSGLLGFGTEHGPFFYLKDGTISMNPYSWNTFANVLYVEQPIGVGFSFSDSKKDYSTGDLEAATDNYVLIKKFFERFPERKNNDFYITSESYGGHYIPQLTKQILENNIDNAINFRGFAVGNPYVDPFSNDVTQYESYYSHGLVSDLVYRPWFEECTTKDKFHKGCYKYEKEIMNELTSGINPYALDFPVCIDEDGSTSFDHLNEQRMQLLKHTKNLNFDLSEANISSTSRRLKYKPCEENFFTDYLNREDVRDALHVMDDAPKWTECSNNISYSRKDVNTPLIDFYKEVVMNGLEHNLNMMVYSGDDDSICSTAGTQYWIYDIGLDVEKKKLWQPWKVNGQIAGYVTPFKVKDGSGSFTFATVHGAGHEVPSYKPEQAFEMLKNFLKQKW